MANKSTNTPKILIVDDEASILHALGLYLRQAGYDTEAIQKYAHYLAGMENNKLPDLVILDILLNQEDGIKIAKELKNDAKTSHIPIILISALPDGRELSKKSGADAFLAKPFSVNDLNQTIDNLLKSRKPTQSAKT